MMQGKIKSHPDMERALWSDSCIGYGGRTTINGQIFDPEESEPALYTPPRGKNKNLPKVFEIDHPCGRLDPHALNNRYKSNVKEHPGGVSDKQIEELTDMSSELNLQSDAATEQTWRNLIDAKNNLNISPQVNKTLDPKMREKEKEGQADGPADCKLIETSKKKIVDIIVDQTPELYNHPSGAVTKIPTYKKNKKPWKNKRGKHEPKSSTLVANYPNVAEYSAGLGVSSDEPTAGARTPLVDTDEAVGTCTKFSILPIPSEILLTPGVDILIKIRIYRPFDYEAYHNKPDSSHCQLYYHDMIISGRNKVSDIKDVFQCTVKPPEPGVPNNGFFFIKNCFYVDNTAAAASHADSLRQWCVARNFGQFPRYDMRTCNMDELNYKLGNPDVYIHDGTCEHIVIFSQARLVNANDPLYFSQYPRITPVSLNNKYPFCYNCAGLNPKWIVSGCIRIPFHKALFCQDCLRQLLYGNDGKKICKFKAYPYKGPEYDTYDMY